MAGQERTLCVETITTNRIRDSLFVTRKRYEIEIESKGAAEAKDSTLGRDITERSSKRSQAQSVHTVVRETRIFILSSPAAG